MNYTTNYNLKKPAGTDAINVNDFNDNADTIDGALKELNDTAEETGQAIAAKYTKPTGGIPENDLSAVVKAKLNAGGTTFIGFETDFFHQGATLSNFTIDGVAATRDEAGAAIFETDNVVIYVTETNVDGTGKHGLQVLRLNDKYGDETISFFNYGYSNIFLAVVDKIDAVTFDFQLVVQ